MLCKVWFGHGTAGWGGVGLITSLGTCTFTWCYIRDGANNVPWQLHNHVMLRLEMGWGGVRIITFWCSAFWFRCTLAYASMLQYKRVCCYASTCLRCYASRCFHGRHTASIVSSITRELRAGDVLDQHRCDDSISSWEPMFCMGVSVFTHGLIWFNRDNNGIIME